MTHKKNKAVSSASNKLLSSISIGLSINIIVILGCFVYLGLISLPSLNSINIKAQSQNLADSQASIINQSLSQIRTRLFHIAQSEAVLGTFQSDDSSIIENYHQELSRAFPEASSVKAISLGPLGIASFDKKNMGLRNNIELDLIRHASNGDTVEPEAYQFENQWLFSIAEPVKSIEKKYADGALLITFDEQFLRKLLNQLDSSLGNTQLFQQFKNNQHLITSTSNESPNTLTIKTETSISNWHLSFTPSLELISQTKQSALVIWILLGISAITVIITAITSYKLLNSAIANNLSALTNDKPNNFIFNLPGFDKQAELIKSLLAEKRKIKPTKTEQASEQSTVTTDPVVTSTSKPEPTVPSKDIPLPADIPELIFQTYAINGDTQTELTKEIIFAIGISIGSEALEQGQQSIIVCADGRHSSPEIKSSLVKGLLASGRDVIDIGTAPIPLMYFATHQLGTQSGIMITSNHPSKEYNGIKIVINGHALTGNAIKSLRDRVTKQQISTGQGEYRTQDIEEAYIDYIINDVAIAQPLKIVIDSANGITGNIAPRLFEELGCEVIPLYCEVDGDFPNHSTDISIETNLQDLILNVKEQQADLGIAFDGDGDKVVIISSSGTIIPADRLLMLLAQDVVSRNPGADVIFDVKCSRNLNTLISNYGGRPIMWKTGHSFIKEKMTETGALLGGEFSGHIFFKERWFGFDDGMYTAARLIEILSTTDPDLDLQISAFPDCVSTPEIKVVTTNEQKFLIIEQLTNNNNFGNGKISTLDGLRVDFPDGWGLVRASNSTATLTLRFEADTPQAMATIQEQFKEQLSSIDNHLIFNF